MMKEKVDKFKALIVQKTEKNNKKTIENLAVFVLILIITIIAINVIWKKDNKKSNEITNTLGKELAIIKDKKMSGNVSNENTEDSIENKLKNILAKIKGVGNVDVLITYSQTSKVIPLYNEDSMESITEETDKEGGSRTINENSAKKEIIYQEENGDKTPITQSIINPKIEGAIITAQGANDVQVKADIISAVEAVTGLGSHKIQVFEMK